MLGRAVAWNVLGQAGTLVIGFVSSILVARWLGPSDRGLLAVIAYSAEVVVAVAGLGLTYAVIYFVSLKNAKAGGVLGNSLLYGLGLAVVFIPLAIVFQQQLADVLGDGNGERAWVVAGVFVPILFLDWSIHNQLFGRLRFDLLNIFTVVSKVIGLVAAIVLVGVVGLGVSGALLALIATSLVMIAATLIVVLPDVRPSVDLRLFQTMVSYGLRVSIGWIFQILNFRVDVILVQQLTNLSTVGYYVIAQIVAELALTFAAAIQSSVTTLTARSAGDADEDDTIVSSLRHQTILTTAAIVLVGGFGPLLIHVGYGSAFDAAVVPMLILLPAMLPLGAGQVVTGNLRGRARPGISSVLAGVTVVVTLSLDFALIPQFGVNGAAIASAVAYTFFGVASVLTISRIVGIAPLTLVVPTRRELGVYRTIAGRVVVRRPSRAD